MDLTGDVSEQALMIEMGLTAKNIEQRLAHLLAMHERETVLAANRELDAFSSSVLHDLRAPLRAIRSFSAFLEESDTGPLNEAQRRFVGRIRANAETLTTLVESLFELSRLTRAEVARARVDLTALGREILTRLKLANPERDVEFVVHESLVVDADPHLLRVAIENLLGNAWKFTSKRPKAQIELGMMMEEAKRVYFIRDDGAGFDMAYETELFTPFKRLHTLSEFEGTGIGLATVQRIIHRHSGRIWAESLPGRGATFYFTLDEQAAA